MQNIMKAALIATSILTLASVLFVVMATYGLTLGAMVGAGTLTGITLALVTE